MDQFLERGRLLLDQDRFELAEKEFRQALVQNGNDPQAHALLAICLCELKRFPEARASADRAIHLQPDNAYFHYVLAYLLDAQDRRRDAWEAISEAIRLDPEHVEFYALQASIFLKLEQWRNALQAAERGLSLESEHVGCLNLRAVALRNLGRPDEAGAVLASALAREPENAATHTNRGWGLLARGDHSGALNHFREALRLDPMQSGAREGIIAALNARNPVYGMLLRFFLWLGRMPQGVRIGVVFGGGYVLRAVSDAMKMNPTLAPVGTLITILYALFVFLTWTADPLFNLLLRLDPIGRLALTRQQVVASNGVGICLLIAAISGLAFAVSGGAAVWLVATGVFLAMTIPVSATLRRGFSNPIGIGMGIYTVALGGVGLATIATAMREPDLPGPWPLGVFILGWAAFTWVGSLISLRR